MRYHNLATGQVYEDLDELIQRVVGDMGPALRHVIRLTGREIPFSEAVLSEIDRSLQRAILRLQQTVELSDHQPTGDDK